MWLKSNYKVIRPLDLAFHIVHIVLKYIQGQHHEFEGGRGGGGIALRKD